MPESMTAVERVRRYVEDCERLGIIKLRDGLAVSDLRDLLDELDSATAERDESRKNQARRFPIQRGVSVPWCEAERAYAIYQKMFGNEQTLERLAQRGGFGEQEFACLWHGGTCKFKCNPKCLLPDFSSIEAQLKTAVAERDAAVRESEEAHRGA